VILRLGTGCTAGHRLQEAPHETERTTANTTQGKLRKTQKRGIKRQRKESLLTANTLLYLNFNQDILIF
jgi:hypothetical protein